MRSLTLGFSPCPNDTFVFHALVHGLVSAGDLGFAARLEDVETLNRLALEGTLDVTKVSYGALPYLLDRYTLLRTGGALGRGCGPLLVARAPLGRDEISRARVAIPGALTTANLLLRLFEPDMPPGLDMSYDQIMPSVVDGTVDAGLIIHESRFTFEDYGLTRVVDLGEWWETTTGVPIPLGAIVARKDLEEDITEVEAGIRSSVEYAMRYPRASSDYVAEHAREMDTDVIARHIALYVNQFTIDLGDDGTAAVRALMDRAADAGLTPGLERDPFRPSLTTL